MQPIKKQNKHCQISLWKIKMSSSNVQVVVIKDTLNNFINVRLKLTKNQANAKQHPEDEYLVLENYSFFIHVVIQN